MSCYRDPTFDAAFANLEREKRDQLKQQAAAERKADPAHIRQMQRKRDRQLARALRK